MVVVMKSGASQAQIEHVVKLVREMGLKDHVIQGTERTVVAVIGDDRHKDRSRFESVDGVEKVVPILAPYKMASVEMKKDRTSIPIGKLGTIGGKKVGVIAGPCSVEDRPHLLEVAHANQQVILCERGIRTFEDYVRNTLPLAIVPELQRRSHLPVVVDPSHGTGKSHLVDSMSRAAVAAGADGLIIEVHNDPAHAMTDGAQSITPQQFADTMKAIRRIAAAGDREI